MDSVYLIVTTLVVGFIAGCTSVGGVLLVPALMAWSSLEPRTVIGTTMVAFFFSGLLGTVMHHRAGRIDYKATLPLCLGAVVCGYAGAVTKQYVPIPVISGLLGVAIVLAGLSALRPVPGGGGIMRRLSARDQNIGLFCIGACVAFLSGMTGAGGPILSVPLMLALGYPAIMTIATARPLQLVVTFSGSLGNLAVGAIDQSMALYLTSIMLVGVGAGTYCVRFFNTAKLRTGVSLLCVVIGAMMAVRSIFF